MAGAINRVAISTSPVPIWNRGCCVIYGVVAFAFMFPIELA
jgi:hypothetical protein